MEDGSWSDASDRRRRRELVLERLIKERFANDTEAALVLDARLDGNDPSQFHESLGLSQKE